MFFHIYFSYFEIRQIMFHKFAYFLSFWNLVDLITLLLNTAVVISDVSGIDERDYITLSGVAVLFVWLKLFYFGRIFISTAAMIRMIIEITYDMRWFLLIFLLAVAAFGN